MAKLKRQFFGTGKFHSYMGDPFYDIAPLAIECMDEIATRELSEYKEIIAEMAAMFNQEAWSWRKA